MYLRVSEDGLVHLVKAVDLHHTVVTPHDQVQHPVTDNVVVVQTQHAWTGKWFKM